MDRGTGIFRWCCWKAGCGFLHCLNTLLAFIAVMLTGLVSLNSLQEEVPIPDKLTQWTLGKALGKNYETVWSTSVFDLRGGLYLRDFQLIRSTNGESVLEAGMIQIDFSLFDLLFGHAFPFEEINATGISLFIPANHSPSGLNEPAMEITQAHLFKSNDQLVVDYLNINAHGLRFYVSGSGPLQSLFNPSGETETLQTANFFTDLLARIHRLPQNIDLDCLVHWSAEGPRQHQFDLFLLSKSLVLPMAQIEDLSLRAHLQIHPEHLAVTKLSGHSILTFLNPNMLPEALAPFPLAPPVAISFSASGRPVETSFFDFPQDIRINLENPFSDNFPVEVLIAETSLGQENPKIHWAIGGLDLFAAGFAQQSAPREPSSADSPAPWIVDLRAQINNPVLHDFFPNIPYHRLLEQAHAGNLRFHASLSTQTKTASGILFSDDLFIGQTQFAHLKSNFFLSASDLALINAHVQRSNNEWAMGSYLQHFPSSRFSLNLYGSSFPQALDSILGSWWSPIFTHIQVPRPPQADVSVWGLWRDSTSLKSVTTVVGEDVVYRGTPTEELRVRVRSNSEWAYLDELNGRFPEGSVTGSLAWKTTRAAGSGMRPMLMDLRSDAPWEAVQAASGVKALGEMKLSGNPVVHVKGVLWSRPKGSEEQSGELIPELQFELSHRNADTEIDGWKLNDLSLSGTVTREALLIDRMSGTLAGGVFTGSLGVDAWQDSTKRMKHIDIELIDASYRDVMVQVIKDRDNSGLMEGALASETGEGRIDTSLDLWISPDLARTRGSGQITLRNAEIGQFHLFGGLSRFLSGIGLGFSTLNLDAGSIDWQLADGTLTIPHCLLTGAVLNLNLSGDVDIIEKQLQLQADAYFFKGLFSKVLTPVSDNFQFDITGPFGNPIWKLRLNPLRWFQNRFPLPSEAKPFQTADD
jgi:hypothetical protein